MDYIYPQIAKLVAALITCKLLYKHDKNLTRELVFLIFNA